MNNKEYTEKIISQVDRILVDSSTLMNSGFKQFISNNKELLLSTGKQIIIPKEVYAELNRHLSSEDCERINMAMNALNLIDDNHDIFIVDNGKLTEDEIAHAFADIQLLSDLNLHRSNLIQLLITNDRNLSCDAFNLNQQLSSRGRKIYVCFINWYGEMQCSDCARVNDDNKFETETVEKEENRPMLNKSHNSTKKSAEPAWRFDLASGGIVAVSFVLLYAICKGTKALLQKL